ncbi:MAG: flagellin [Tepidisphaerales bacterium]
MARINTNVAALQAQLGLAKAQQSLNSTLQRLSTGLKINSGADNPAGLIASEGLRSEMAGIQQGIDNSQQAENVIATTEGSLNEVSSLLTNIKQLVVQAANSGAMSQDEIDANQLQIDSAIASITRISNTSSFAGLKLLDGSLDYVTSGVDTTQIDALHVHSANFGTQATIPVNVNVITSARNAELQFQTSSITNSVNLAVSGPDGVTNLTFVSGTTASAIAYAVNQVSDSTGVKAKYINAGNVNSGITFYSSTFGSKSYVSVDAKRGTFNTVNMANAAATRATGVDAVATVNGALTVADGLHIMLNTSTLDLELTLKNTVGTTATSFTVTGGGSKFQLGPQVNSAQQLSLGIQSVAATSLGDSDVGFLSDIVSGGPASLRNGSMTAASNIIERAINQVAVLRGRLGAFQKNTLDTNINSLQTALENVTQSESNIRDADFAAETSNLTRAQILTQAGTSVLATANSTPQSVLKLLQ